MALTVAANAITFSDSTSLSSGNIQGAQIVPGTITNDRIANNAITNNNLSLQPNDTEIKKAVNADGPAPIYVCRALVNFNGASTPPFIRPPSKNISSVTRNSTGNYTVSFETAMTSSNYVYMWNAERGGSVTQRSAQTSSGNTSSITFVTNPQGTNTGENMEYIRIIIIE